MYSCWAIVIMMKSSIDELCTRSLRNKNFFFNHRLLMGEGDQLTRIAIVSEDKCKPKKCRQECKKSCPVVKQGSSSKLTRLKFYRQALHRSCAD
jgi:hypothetical protein